MQYWRRLTNYALQSINCGCTSTEPVNRKTQLRRPRRLLVLYVYVFVCLCIMKSFDTGKQSGLLVMTLTTRSANHIAIYDLDVQYICCNYIPSYDKTKSKTVF